MNGNDRNRWTCDQVIDRLEEAFDHGADIAMDRDMAAHLASCDACRGICEALTYARRELGEWPTIPFPGEALSAVWAATVDRERPARSVRWFAESTWVAVAASLAFAAAVSWFAWYETTTRQDRQARAVAEAKYVLAVTAGAMQRVESVAVEDVLETRVGGALKNLTNQWTQLSEPLRRRSGT